jgi:hypothetical protein
LATPHSGKSKTGTGVDGIEIGEEGGEARSPRRRVPPRSRRRLA